MAEEIEDQSNAVNPPSNFPARCARCKGPIKGPVAQTKITHAEVEEHHLSRPGMMPTEFFTAYLCAGCTGGLVKRALSFMEEDPNAPLAG